LSLTARSGESGALVLLNGTDRWQDAEVAVETDERPRGQFWMYIRRGSSQSFVRLGIVGGQAVLQKSAAGGETRQLASRPLGAGRVRLTLRVIGSRVIAFADGEPLVERPGSLPADLARGSFALAVWNPEGVASATVRRVEARPLFRRAGIIPVSAGEADWARLRREANGLWAVSPRLFTWRRGKPPESTAADTAVTIFARHHRLALLPAVSVPEAILPSELQAFGAQVARWAETPGFDGLNLVLSDVDTAIAAGTLLEDLRGSLQRRGKHLAVTVPAGPALGHSFFAGPGLLRARAGSATSFTTAEGSLALVESG
jgi:hypothetical protein